jgi:cytochrome c oxidase assembly protein subunit 11
MAEDGGTGPAERRRPERGLTGSLWLMAAGSFVFGFALVPLYDVICEAAGIRVNTAPSTLQASDLAAGRKVEMEFMSILAPGSDMEILPVTTALTVQPGKLQEARFRIRNREAVPVVAQAVPSVAPSTTARYLQKTECFCFTPQTFAAGEEREFTVRFILDPALPVQIDRMTLAYSMYVVPEQKLAAR